MPGANCAVFGCGSCRRTKGIGIWKLPVAKDEAHRKWRDEWHERFILGLPDPLEARAITLQR